MELTLFYCSKCGMKRTGAMASAPAACLWCARCGDDTTHTTVRPDDAEEKLTGTVFYSNDNFRWAVRYSDGTFYVLDCGLLADRGDVWYCAGQCAGACGPAFEDMKLEEPRMTLEEPPPEPA
jgi:hypothetical protein